MNRLLLSIGLIASVSPLPAADPSPLVRSSEAARVEVIRKVKPAVAAVCFFGGEACGSGVVIDAQGYCLTNFHVVQPTGPVLQCGLADGKLYDAVLVGVDKVGDVALVKLLPREPGKPFPFVALADSDTVRPGDWSLAMGNPFGLSLDFTPTVTYGLVSGTNRYQPPEGKGTLEYTDCIQIETSINPGNSGGPLFNMKGELIGINGRGSFEKRGRVNSGVGYAISINQIKNFLGHLRSGLDTDHATLGADVATENEEGDLSRMLVRSMLEDADAVKQGIQPGDQLVKFAGRTLSSANQYKNILGIFPREWRLPLTYRRDNVTRETLVRLMGHMDRPVEKAGDEQPKPPGGRPAPAPPKKPGQDASPANKLFTAKKGYANYFFNLERQNELKAALAKQGNFADRSGTWTLDGTIELVDRRGDVKVTWAEDADGLTAVTIIRNGIRDSVIPLKPGATIGELMLPQGSGGLLTALYQYRRLLTSWEKGFEAGFDHGGTEPVYPPRADGAAVDSLKDLRMDADVIRAKHASLESKWYYTPGDHRLIACEAVTASEELPCELFFGEYKKTDGRELPHRIEVRIGEKKYAVIVVKTWTLGGKS